MSVLQLHDMPNDITLDEVMDILGDVGSQIGDALQITGHHQIRNQGFYTVGLLPDLLDDHAIARIGQSGPSV